MTTFCIGDVHAQLKKLDQLLCRLDTIDANAEIWFVGDLINRGPDSAGVLRRVRQLGERAHVVLGNHDLTVLATAADSDKQTKVDTGVLDLLSGDDADDLLNWLRYRPLIHDRPDLDWIMVHAGVPACWGLAEAKRHAREFENALRSPDWMHLFKQLFGNEPSTWSEAKGQIERNRYIANALTRQRFCEPDSGVLDMKYKKTVAAAPTGLVPWFAAKDRRSREQRIVFGHWAALGRIAWPEHNVWCVDTGASWGGPLTAIELECQSIIYSVR